MADLKRSGKALLRPVDGRQGSGSCAYNIGPKGAEAAVAALVPGAGALHAVLQFGPDKGYRCRPAEPLGGTLKCAEAGIMAVWVLDGDKPALFGLIGSGPFDQAEARRRLQEDRARPDESQARVKAAAAVLPSVPAPQIVRPSYREPAGRDAVPPFLSAQPQPGAAPPDEGGAPPGVPHSAPIAVRAMQAPVQAAVEQPVRAQAMPAAAPYLAVKHAPRPTPRPPVYSPLWDDVSVEFEKLLDSLPKAQPFNGNVEGAEIAELPTAGAVQCYVGSVAINGMKVFLQAVPARPYARPAGFDHSLVARSGDCYWVKYFIQDT